MDIKSPEQFKSGIEKLVLERDDKILNELGFDIARYIVYNYYLNIHIKADSPEDKENERIYLEFKEKYPEMYKKVWELEKYLFKKMERDF